MFHTMSGRLRCRLPSGASPASLTGVKSSPEQNVVLREGVKVLGVPHSFQNLDNEVAELVVIFPTNVWEYDVLDYFPFNTPEAKALAKEAKEAKPRAN